MLKECDHKERERDRSDKMKFPYTDHVLNCDDVALELGIFSSINQIKNEHEHKKMLWYNGMTASDYCLDNNNESALRELKLVDEMVNKVYEFERNKPLKYEQVVDKFKKFYPYHMQ
jgi:hypothetical protein